MCKCDCISIQIHLNQCGCAISSGGSQCAREGPESANGLNPSNVARVRLREPVGRLASQAAIRPHVMRTSHLARPGQSCGQRIADVAAAWLACRNCRGQIPPGPADPLDVYGAAVFRGNPRLRPIRIATMVAPIALVDTEPKRASGLPTTGVHPNAGVAWASIVRPRRYPATRFAQPRQPSPDSTWPPACHGCRRWRCGWSAGYYL